ncbi:hypothetical protein [Erwinia amylovora]
MPLFPQRRCRGSLTAGLGGRFSTGLIVTAVSYTHLGVYKRQA